MATRLLQLDSCNKKIEAMPCPLVGVRQVFMKPPLPAEKLRVHFIEIRTRFRQCKIKQVPSRVVAPSKAVLIRAKAADAVL